MSYNTRSTRFGFFLLLISSFIPASAQTVTNLFCADSATPLNVKSEGLAERMGDIVMSCSGGTPGFVVTGNISVSLSVPLTNRLTFGTATDILLTVDTGSGAMPVAFTPQLLTSSTVSLNGLSFTIPATGALVLRISNLRGSMTGLASPSLVPQSVVAFLSLNGLSTVSLTNNSQLTVAYAVRGLLSGTSSTVIRCVGSPLPSTASLSNFFAVGTHFESTRVTEGFASSFQPKGSMENAGTRFLIGYKNVPMGVMLFVPDVIAGSDALMPTGGGDLGVKQSGGQYTPGSQTLLLARVQGADSSGNGGTPVYTPAGGPAVMFDTVTQLAIGNGSASVVYEVMDSNNTVMESAQFPTFVGLASTGVSAGNAQETVSFAPVSTDATANSSALIPRFTAIQPPSDCQTIGDCNAGYFPSLVLISQGIFFTAFQGGLALQPPGYIAVQNSNPATSLLNWTASVKYQDGSDWLFLEGNSGINDGSVRVFAQPQKLAAGTYRASVIVDGGAAGVKSIPAMLIVTALPPNPNPTPTVTPPGITSVTNSANFLPGPVVSGSLAMLTGTNLTGKLIAVTFDGLPATILSQTATQIKVQVPDGLGAKTSSQVVVTVDGTSSPAMTIPLAAVAPAIFADGIVNEDGSGNNATSGVPVGHIVQIFLTGLPENTGTVLVKIHDREDLVPVWAGPAPGKVGVQQVNVAVPADLPAMTTTTLVCGMDPSGNKVCSAAAPLTLADAPQTDTQQ